jgi:glycosyltransferase involved in cell wall biosynthesis
VDFRDEGITYSVLTLEDARGGLWDDMASRDVVVRTLGLSNVTLEQVPRAAYRVRRALRDLQPDVVHSILFYSGLATELARTTLRAGPPSVLARHHEKRLHFSERPIHVRLDGWMARRATRVAAASQAVRKVLVELEGVTLDHIDVILYGLDWNHVVSPNPARSAEWRARFGDTVLLMAAGRLSPEKDYPTLLEALAEVVATEPRAHLAIAGTGPLEHELKSRTSALDLDRHVTWLGWVDGVYDLMSAADGFVQASTDEALPQTIMEAAGLGLPVVATTVGGAPEILGAAAPRIAAGDARALAAHLQRLVEDVEGSKARALKYATEVRAKFDPSRMAQEYADLYRRVLPTQGPLDAATKASE